MPKESKETVIKNGKTYYTSTYFASKVNLGKRAAREYLKTFNHEEISKNPKLYTRKIMDIAISNYLRKNSSESEADIEAKILAKDLEITKDIYMQIHGLTKDDIAELEKNNYDFRKPKKIQEPGISIEEICEIERKDTERTSEAYMRLMSNSLINEPSRKYDVLLTHILKSILSILGYEFNFNLLKEDVYTTEHYWIHKGPATAKSLSEIEAFKRINSNDGYLIKIK